MVSKNLEETDDIEPQLNDVIIARSSGSRNHFGTQRFHGMIDMSPHILCGLDVEL